MNHYRPTLSTVRGVLRAVTLALWGLVCWGAQPAQAAGTHVLHDKFQAQASGAVPAAPWSVVSTGGGSVTVRDVPFAGDRSVRLQKLATTGVTSLSTSVADLRGRVAFEARVMARETQGFKALPYIYDAAGVAVASVAFQDGAIKSYVGGSAEVVQAFEANVWYLVRVVVDTDTDQYDLFVDGVRKQVRRPLRNATESVRRVSFFLDGVNTGTVYVDSVRIYTEAEYIGPPPGPVFDVRSFGAVGNGTTKDTAAIQRAIDAAAGTGGSVVLRQGTFLSGTLTLRSHMTFYLEPTATLLGSTAAADYPAQSPATGNTQLHNCRRALLYAPGTVGLRIDGGGTIDGQGDSFGGAESARPMLIWAVLSRDVAVRNLYLKKGAMWSLVSMESDQVRIDNLNLQSDRITHDGIDIVDGYDVVVQHVAVRSGDDAMCVKTGVRRGLDTVTIRDSVFSGSGGYGGSNGIKFGTASYGAFRNIHIEDSYVKDVQYAAMAVESRQGADVDQVSFRRVHFANVGSAFFVYLAQQSVTAPVGDVPKLGSMRNVSFTDVTGWTRSWFNSPHQGSLITGHLFNGIAYRIANLSFTNVAVTFVGGRGAVPGAPPEAQPNQYPESNMFGDLPAWGYYLRHVDGVTFQGGSSALANPDARGKLVTSDVRGLAGAP